MFRGIGVHLSTHEQIMEVFESEISEKTQLVVSKFGPCVLYGGLRGFQIETHPCSEIISCDTKTRRKKKGK